MIYQEERCYMPTIYCVEDDMNIRELVLYALRASGFEAEGFDSATPFFEHLDAACPDLVLLDIMLPGTDGLSILHTLRETPRTANLPVILLTAKTAEYDKVRGLDDGADDYLCKPFGVMELISRIKAVLRRSAPTPTTNALTLGEITLDTARHTVQSAGQPVILTLKEFDLLHYLMENVNIVLTREKIMEAVWGFGFEGESRTVDMHIKTLRQKLGTSSAQIQTVRGVGYKIEAEAK